MADDKRSGPKSREYEERSVEEYTYRPPSNLPDPAPQDGYEFRWIRSAMLGEKDDRNMSMRLREGWEPCQMEDHPEFRGLISDRNGIIEVGGLILAKCSTVKMDARAKHFRKQAQMQMASVDNNFMRENDPRMPLMKPERETRVSFGNGRPVRDAN